MSSKDLNKLMDEFLTKVPKKDPTQKKDGADVPTKKEVKMNPPKINPNGGMDIGFNQPVHVPFNFIEN